MRPLPLSSRCSEQKICTATLSPPPALARSRVCPVGPSCLVSDGYGTRHMGRRKHPSSRLQDGLVQPGQGMAGLG